MSECDDPDDPDADGLTGAEQPALVAAVDDRTEQRPEQVRQHLCHEQGGDRGSHAVPVVDEQRQRHGRQLITGEGHDPCGDEQPERAVMPQKPTGAGHARSLRHAPLPSTPATLAPRHHVDSGAEGRDGYLARTIR